MSTADHLPLSRTRLRIIGEQLANDRKLDILRYTAEKDTFEVATLTDELDLPHTTAHEYCRDLQQAGLLRRAQDKPAVYEATEFDIHLSLDQIAQAVEAEGQTLTYATDRYGENIVDDVLTVWDRVEAGNLTYREASESVEMEHADFLRLASELELLG